MPFRQKKKKTQTKKNVKPTFPFLPFKHGHTKTMKNKHIDPSLPWTLSTMATTQQRKMENLKKKDKEEDNGLKTVPLFKNQKRSRDEDEDVDTADQLKSG